MNTDNRHLSYTQISTYLTCPLRYRFQYVDQIPPAFVSATLAFGSGIHEAVGAFYQMVLQGDQLKPSQMLDVYRQAWLGRQEKVKFFNGDNEASLLNRAEQLLTVFHESFNPAVVVLGVEEFFAVDLAGVPPLQGYIDLIEQSPEGRITVVDLKTASRKSSDNAAHANLQLTAYSLGAESLGFDPDELLLRLDVLVKTKVPDFVRYETCRTASQRDRFTKIVRQVWNGIEREVWFPNEDWHCTQCAFAEPCSNW